MNDLVVSAPQQADRRVPTRAVEDVLPVYDSDRFAHYGRIATVMAKASLVPKTLKGAGFEEAQANCFQVVELSDRWGYSPFAVAQCASVVHGKLMLEGKLVAAVLESKLGIELQHYYTGEWGKDDYRIYVTDVELTPEQIAALKPHVKFHGVKMVDGSVGEWKTFEQDKRTTSGNWLKQPDVQLQYRGDRTWARLFKSALMLGVLTDDEIDDLADRQESRRPALTAGPDLAALEAARSSMVQPMAARAAEPSNDIAAEAQPVHEQTRAGDGEGTAQEPHVEPDPGDAQDASKTIAPADEVYLIADESSGDDGKRQTYKNGKGFSRATDKAAGRLKTYDLHAPAQEAPAVPLAVATSSPAADAASPASGDGTETAAGTPGTGGPTSDGAALLSAPHPEGEAVADDAEFTEGSIVEAEVEIPTEDEPPLHPLLAGKMEIDGANSAQEIRAVIQRVTPSDAFKEAAENSRALFRMAAWERYVILRDRGTEDGKVTTDVILFSLWIEFGAKTKAEIDDLWARFYAGEVYKGLADGWKRALAQLLARRKAVLP